jgi:beta-glucosidase
MDPPHIEADGRVTISAEIKNIGARAGDEVVQLYIRDEVASVPRPVKELKGFKRIHLEPDETRTVVFEMPTDQLGFYDEAMQLVVEPGTIQVMIGGSSEDIRLNASFEILGNEKRSVPRRIFGGTTQIENPFEN